MEDKIRVCLKGDTKILLNKSDGRRIIAGYANVAVIDQDNQYIPLAVLQKGIQTLLADPTYANLMIMHKNIQIGKIIESYGKYKTGVDNKGLFIVCEIRKDIQVADEIWGMILKKEISGFSIGCEVLLSHKVCDDKECVTVLDKINIFEVSVCTEPVNQKSGFAVVSKSQFEQFRGNLDMLNVYNEKGNVMEEKLVKEEAQCTECSEPIELSVEERLEDLEKKMMDLIETLNKKVKEEKPEEEKPEEEEEDKKPFTKEKSEIPIETEQKQEKKPVDEEKPEEEEEEEKKPFTKEKSEIPIEEDMAVFMLDYIIKNPKASANDIAGEWIKSKKAAEEKLANPQDMLMDAFSKFSKDIGERLTKLEQAEELKQSLKARDDTIQALEKKIEILNKSKETEKKEEPIKKEEAPVKKEETKKPEPEIKTIQKAQEPVLEEDKPFYIRDGVITSSEFM